MLDIHAKPDGGRLGGSEMEGAIVIDVDELVASAAGKLQPENSGDEIHNSEFPLFYRIKPQLCDKNEEVYEPNVLTIGPYHHKAATTLEIEKMKWASLSDILKLNPKKKMRDYIKAMEELEQRIRSSYACEISMNSYDLLKMVLLDGSFILLFLHPIDEITRSLGISCMEVDSRQSTQTNCEGEANQDDTSNTTQWYAKLFTRDMLLLENQIPFFIVIKIYELVTDGNSSTSLLMENISNSIGDLINSYPKASQKFDQPKPFHHLLHVCHTYFKPKQTQVKNNRGFVRPRVSEKFHHFTKKPSQTSYCHEAGRSDAQVQLFGWHRAGEYQRAGIKFKKKEFHIDNPHSLLDIEFCDGIMEMPCLTIDPNTFYLFRNMVAFEQTCPQFGNYMTAYVVFLSQFINTSDDVSILTGRGLLVHQLNSDAEVCRLFQMLCVDVTFDFNGEYCFKNLCHAMERHYQVHRPMWRDLLGMIASKVPLGSRD